MTTTHQTSLSRAETPAARAVGKRRAASVLTASVAAMLIWVAAVALADVDLVVGSGADMTVIGPGAVATVSLLAGLAAVGLAALLARVTRRAGRIWYVVALATLILSLAGPLGATTVGAALTLAAMHIVVGVTLIVGIGATIDTSARQRG